VFKLRGVAGCMGAGLGLYEYMLLSEELGTEPIWVINNGIRCATPSRLHDASVG
jgi:alpha-L-arabinofuranosidase